MSEEKKVVKENETGDSGSVKLKKEKKSSGIGTLIVIVLLCLLAVFVALIFFNGQKLNQQVVDLERDIATLQTGEKEVGQRLLALEDEFVVLSLKHRLNKVNKSRKDLLALKLVLADNPEMVDKVQVLVDDLAGELERLEAEISGNQPKLFNRTRPSTLSGSQTLRPACYPGCVTSGQCLVLQKNQQSPLVIKSAPAHAAIAPGAVHAAPKAGSALAPKADSAWARFINRRLFGNQ
ncbi:MAG: hypothetical protein KAG92_07245 [Deltaproteobacteria bacterium]|nr:hypothetical protein [Deltaproteobacteria bacterium]